MAENEEMKEKKEKKDQKAQKPEPKTLMETKRIIRILDTNLDSNLKISRALSKIKGISFMFSNAICASNGINPETRLSSLDDNQVRMLEQSIKNPAIPAWMLNRRKDMKTGKDIHITSSDIDIMLREDVMAMKKMRAYKGIRHEMGQPVRGQRTRNTSRKNKSVGVVKKKAMPQKSAKS